MDDVPPTLPDVLWIVEYNAEQRTTHVDTLQHRIMLNVQELLRDGEESGRRWVPIAITQEHEKAADAAISFRNAMEEMHGEKLARGKDIEALIRRWPYDPESARKSEGCALPLTDRQYDYILGLSEQHPERAEELWAVVEYYEDSISNLTRGGASWMIDCLLGKRHPVKEPPQEIIGVSYEALMSKVKACAVEVTSGAAARLWPEFLRLFINTLEAEGEEALVNSNLTFNDVLREMHHDINTLLKNN